VILVETSAWIEYDRDTGSDVARRLGELIESGASIACSDPILMEILAGARNDAAAKDLQRLLTSFSWIPTESTSDFESAARIYRLCRATGHTPRGMIDCLIAAIALRSGAALLTTDRDFVAIAQVFPLRFDLPAHGDRS